MANFTEIKVFGYGKDGVTIYKKYLEKPYPLYINIDAIEYISPIYEGNLNITNDDGSTFKQQTKYVIIIGGKYRYFSPASEFNKLIKEAETL